jgi:diguanylate cyclase (GGDEF)-like protein
MTTNPENDIMPKVLVVDDHEANLVAMARVLSHLSVEIFRANSGEMALSLSLEHDFAVILLDVQMPDMDGFEVADLLCSNKKTAHMPIIFVTAINKEDRHIELGHKLGAVDYLFKPVDPLILTSKVKVFCQLYRREKYLEQLLSENKKINQQLKYLAHYDSLTKLPNRLQFEDNFNRIISSASRHQRLFALMLIDLDGFKAVNDTHGHHVGDLLLQAVSDKLKDCFRQGDIMSTAGEDSIVARLGGDEFAVILDELKSTDDAGIVAKRAIEQASITYNLSGIDVRTSMSIGIACFPKAGNDFPTLYKNADAALYVAKGLGKNRYQYYSDDLNNKHLKHLSIEKALSVAVEKKEFSLFYQPIYQLKTRALIGMEALVRWTSEDLGSVPPDQFIPIAEESGMILPISEWILNEAFTQQNTWHNTGYKTHFLAINLSSKQFLQDDLYKKMMLLAKGKNILNNIHLELTETALMVDLIACEEVLSALKKQGFSLSIDDFGTGSSSFLRLKTLPIDTIKIDRSFITNIDKDKTNAIIVKSILALAHNLNLNVIAEGIETKAEYDFLIEHGCEQGQGYYFSKPIPEKEMAALLKKETGTGH